MKKAFLLICHNGSIPPSYSRNFFVENFDGELLGDSFKNSVILK